MKIAINCIYYGVGGGGVSEYIYNLVKELIGLNNDYNFVFYITEDSEIKFKELTKGRGVVKIFPFDSRNKIKRAFLQSYFWREEEEIERFDVFHSPFFYGPKFKKAKTVLTVHDLRFLNYPRSYEIKRFLFLRYAVKKSIKQADKIITISNFTKNEIHKFYNIELSKIRVIYEAVDIGGFKFKNNDSIRLIEDESIVSLKFMLAVGHIEPRKNYVRLIDSYLALPQNLREQYKLVIVGKKNHDFKKIISKIEKAIGVIYLNYVSRDDLIWLYANCKVHVFPSYYEGFGFSSLESGLFGKPTIGANQSSIPEISGKGGLYFNPFSPLDITEKIINILSDENLYNELSKNALKNTEKYSWIQNAIETCQVYDSCDKIKLYDPSVD
jgi:glycosyltransferase involved in cell wall biosynthesis